ncbi:hypothetical protein BN3087_330027 [Sulfurovum sp. enrichment culture clone C5]|uniref:Uncharacterized protein n=1 Tax=Sulfurovum sp. enrichment culture clone C5 TaxID=497650 RepID=A0A0S4XM97_9BACT|nr:hypothetical protein BN3087_330027 [Sulfurovum sp. enrichment culture clone C5]
MRLSTLIVLIVIIFNLFRLLYFGEYSGGKVYVEKTTFAILTHIIAILFLLYIFYKSSWEPNFVKCPKCKETFNYKDTLEGKCPNCKDVDTIDIKEYYEKFPDEKDV